MKSRFLIAACISMTASLFASSGAVDERLFLEPHVTELASKSASMSLNVGQNIPSTTHVVANDVCRVVGLGAHFRALADELAEGAESVVAAPASYDVVFTDGSRSDEEVRAHIDAVLEEIGESGDPQAISKMLGELSDVYRATFVRREGRLILVTNEKDLRIGEAIWRKTPTGAEINVYHSEEEYLVSLQNAGLKVDEIKRPCFFGEVKWKAYNASLGEGERALGAAYIDHNPFTIYIVKKA